MAEVDPGCSCFRHLVEQVIPEKLQQVAVSGLRPRWVLLEPDARNTRLRTERHLRPRSGQSGSDTHSGRSLMVPSLASKRKRRPFWTSCRQRFWLIISTILRLLKPEIICQKVLAVFSGQIQINKTDPVESSGLTVTTGWPTEALHWADFHPHSYDGLLWSSTWLSSHAGFFFVSISFNLVACWPYPHFECIW